MYVVDNIHIYSVDPHSLALMVVFWFSLIVMGRWWDGYTLILAVDDIPYYFFLTPFPLFSSVFSSPLLRHP